MSAFVLPEGATPEQLREVSISVAERLDELEAGRETLLSLVPEGNRADVDAKFTAARLAFDALLAELTVAEG